MPGKSIEIIVKPAYIRYTYLYVPAKHMGFFPPGAVSSVKQIVLETDTGSVEAQLQHNRRGYI
jgi:hypothetical protein